MGAEAWVYSGRSEFKPQSDPLRELRAIFVGVRGLSSVRIGIIDGLPDLTHPSLAKASIEILKTMVPEGFATPDQHCTAICSIIFGDSNVMRGIAPGCSGIVLPIFFVKTDEPAHASEFDLARAVTFALGNDVSIINISAGKKVSGYEADAQLEQALQYSVQRRILVIAAAGNDGCACFHLPAAINSVLAVGATDIHGQPLEISNWGEPYRRTGLLAPGQGLTAAIPRGGTRLVRGTSFATAVVSGVAGLLLSVARREGYAIDALDVGRILIESASQCRPSGEGYCDRYLAGTLDAGAALAMLHSIGGRQLSGIKLAAPTTNLHSDQSRHFGASHGKEDAVMTAVIPSHTANPPTSAIIPADCASSANSEEASKETDCKQTTTPPLRSAANLAKLTGGALTGVSQQGCSCGQSPQLVYALGALWYDFGTEARYDVFVQHLGDPVRANNPTALLSFLRDNLEFTTGLTFILMQEQVPLYAIHPTGPFAERTYTWMLKAIQDSIEDGGADQRVSIPGIISGTTSLINGMPVSVVNPDLRGMYKWRPQDFIDNTRELVQGRRDSDDQLLNFLYRVYYELRNFGVLPQERALNFAATNAYQARNAFAEAAAKSLVLDEIKVMKSPIGRPDSECWDIELSMFDDKNDRIPNQIHRFTVDVSEVIPVQIGPRRTWAKRASSS